MNKICVYAIAKNESKNVELWVESMKVADHIIVLDTGSTDDTVKKLQKLGVEVHQKIYEHFRFDTARNDSLDLIPNEYNIRVCTDLDERFESSDWAEILRENWDETRPRVQYNYVWAHTEDGKPGLQFILNKIHGIDPNLRWAGAVHEHLTYMDTGERHYENFINLIDKITLHHYPDFQKDRQFYIKLMEERLEENLLDGYSYVQLGNEYRMKGRPQDAIPIYEKGLEQCIDQYIADGLLAGVYYNLGEAYYATDQTPQAVIAYSKGIATDKTYRDNYYGLAIIWTENEMFDAAIGLLEQSLLITTRKYNWLEDNFMWTYNIYDLLGYCYSKKGNYQKALSNAALALQYESTNPILQLRYEEYINNLI